jgi:hypothetical protein
MFCVFHLWNSFKEHHLVAWANSKWTKWYYVEAKLSFFWSPHWEKVWKCVLISTYLNISPDRTASKHLLSTLPQAFRKFLCDGFYDGSTMPPLETSVSVASEACARVATYSVAVSWNIC